MANPVSGYLKIQPGGKTCPNGPQKTEDQTVEPVP